MTAAVLVLAALAVAAQDRLRLADSLFNRGDAAAARVEYAALAGDKSVPADELLYRMAECDRALGKQEAAQAFYAKLLAEHPTSRHADRARIMRARSLKGPARVTELKTLDSDRVAPAIRAEALYRLGEATGEADFFTRSAKTDPKGPYALYARYAEADILVRSKDADTRRRGVTLLLEIAFGETTKLSEGALYLAASVSFADRRYGESLSLGKRYLKRFPEGANAKDAAVLCAWSEFLSGRYADVLARVDGGTSDDFIYLRAAAARALGETAVAAKRYEAYLDGFPQGRYRAEAEKASAQLARDAAEKGTNVVTAVAAAERCVKVSDTAANRLHLAWAQERAGRPEEAARTYASVATKSPGTVEAAQAMFAKAMIDLRAKRWAAADLALREALAGKLDARRRPEACYWRGVAACQVGHEAEGEKLLKEALAGDLTLDCTREARLMLADIAYNSGRTNEAVTAYAKLVEEGAVERMGAAKAAAVGRLLKAPGKRRCGENLAHRDSPEWRQTGYALIGEAAEEEGAFAAAKEAYAKCAAEKSETEVLPQAMLRLGRYRAKDRDLDGAEKALRRAVELNAKDDAARAAAYLALAQVAEARGDAKAARGYLTVVTTLFERTPSAPEATAALKRLEGK